MNTNASNTGKRQDRLPPLVEGELQTSLLGYYAMIDMKTYREIEGLAEFLRNARSEIAALQPHQIPEHDIPLANDELGAVVQATEAATGTILDAVEMMEGLCSQLTPEQAAVVQTAITKIYEACNFQDITGQRVTKVVQTLTKIETRVDGVLEALGEEVAKDRSSKAKAPPPVLEEKTGDAALMNGPQLPSSASTQDEIDALFASFG